MMPPRGGELNHVSGDDPLLVHILRSGHLHIRLAGSVAVLLLDEVEKVPLKRSTGPMKRHRGWAASRRARGAGVI